MIILSFRKILKNLKTIIKTKKNFFIFNIYIKKNFFYKFNFTIFYYKKLNILKILKKNFIVFFLLKNNGNINSCIRTSYLFKTISIINIKKKKSIYNYFENIFFIKSLFFFIFFIKKSFLLIGLTIKSSFLIKKIKNKLNYVILVGNEKRSIKKKYLNKLDILLKIKTYCNKSLNVNVITGIILFNLK